MTKSKLLFSLLASIIAGLLVVVTVKAFTGPGSRTPGSGNPDYWAGVAGQVLTSNGVGVAPSFQAPASSGMTLPSGAVFMMITGSCPSGTTDVSATYSNKFIRINATAGSTGGADTHTHAAGSYTSPTTGSTAITEANLPSHTHAAGTLTGGAHLHTLSSYTFDDNTEYPSQTKATIKFTTISAPTQFEPSWVQGSASYYRADSGGAVAVTGSTGAIGSGTGHTHTGGAVTGTSASGDNIPAYVTAKMCQVN